MITLSEYLMNRDKDFPLDMQQARNAADLLSRVNYLFGRLNLKATVSSGYRPSSINASVNGAKMSAHTTCQAIDLLDVFGKIGTLLRLRTDLLEECGLYLENPDYTVKTNKDGTKIFWVHLQCRPTKSRVFIPY